MTPLREQCLSEMLRCISEWRAASPAFRPFWRDLALHEIRQFRRWFLIPERRAFEAAVVKRMMERRAA